MGILVIVLLALALVWGIWLIFKHDMMKIKLGELASYFMGVLITLICVGLITTRFVPWWLDRLIADTQQSQQVQSVQTAVEDILKDALSSDPIIATAVPVQPQPTTPPAVPPTEGGTGDTQSSTSQSIGQQTHTVQSGETLYKLSKKYAVTVVAIQQANNLTDETIQVGQELVIPATP